jgi:hypothetical protein
MDSPEGLEKLQGTATLSLELVAEQVVSLFLLLQNGFFVKACVGCTIKDFFVKQLGLSPDYIETRIQGIFLDSKPADDIETAILRDGARLTLSGTMPGLVGIALRRGPLAVFRHSITHRETGNYTYSGDGYIQLKLLNLLMKDMGPELLRKGIYTNLPTDFWQGCKTISLDGRQIAPEIIQRGEWISENRLVKFSVVPA